MNAIRLVVAAGLAAAWASGPAQDLREQRRPRWLFSDFAVPVFERGFDLATRPHAAELDIAVGGWFEVAINGRRIDDFVMNPPVVAYMKRVPGFRIDVAEFLNAGSNTIAITVAPGWYGSRTREEWGFAKAPWLDYPAVRAELRADGCQVLRTDTGWRQVRSPITFSQFRAGEFYDARLEAKRESKPAFEVSYPPRGAVSYDCDANPVRTFEAFEPKSATPLKDGTVRYDFGVNLAGWCEIEVEGAAGAKVTLDHDEKVKADGSPHGGIGVFVKDAVAQRDEYVLAGRAGGEKWHPRFTYHGFRYAWVKTTGKVTVKAIRARVVHSDLPEVGGIETDSADFNALLAATRRSYLSNFVGIPTDCPPREKNGWTGDAQLAMETGLWNFDGSRAYRSFLRMMTDTQLANGQVSCILPTAYSFGFGWGSGPAWDAVLFEFPWQLRRFGGDERTLAEAYPHMVRYLGYLESVVRDDGTVGFGLGDWCPADGKKLADRDLVVTAISCGFYDKAAVFADILGKAEDAGTWRRRAALLRTAFRARFGHGNGSVGKDYSSELAVALAFEMLPEGERASAAKRLAEQLRKIDHRVDFGLVGGKYVPRMLAQYGYADDAFELFVQKRDPGWQSMLKTGDGALWEEFDGANSHNHIMYGDNSAWAYEYLAGIKPLEPGFRRVRVKPCFVKKLGRVTAWHQTPQGRLAVEWRRKDGAIQLKVTVPQGVRADIELPDGRIVPAAVGENSIRIDSGRSA